MNNGEFPWHDQVTQDLLLLLNDEIGYAAPEAPEVPIAGLPDIDSKHHIALCLGHGREGDEGNVGFGGESEEEYNFPLLSAVASRLESRGFKVSVITDYEGKGYTAAMTWLAHKLRTIGATCALEFHFNAANKRARGHEVLHWEGSQVGVTLAGSLLRALDEEFPEQPSRGLKPRSSRNRGALFLSLTHCPAALLEPFFGDQRDDWKKFSSAQEFKRLANAYAEGVCDWIKLEDERREYERSKAA
ncbi:MAG: N-acetylmuramoyl-L-alanine amidase [Verrucomicrobiota bacterium]